jgi:hypothetical protein
MRMGSEKTQVDGSFTAAVQEVVARRTGFRCSNPRCRKPTMGPFGTRFDSYIYLGEVAHICTTQPKSERFDGTLSMEQRGAVANAIHLCCTCNKIVNQTTGSASNGYTVALMREWKQQAEAQAETALLRGEDCQRVLGELQAEVKLLALQVANLTKRLNEEQISDSM